MMGSSGGEEAELMNQRETKKFRNNFLAGLFFTLPLVVVMMVLPLFPPLHEGLMRNLLAPDSYLAEQRGGSLNAMSLCGFLLATPVQFWVGGVFYRRAWAALKHGGSNMDVLIALGTSVAYFYSLANVVLVLVGTPNGGSSGGGVDDNNGGDHGTELHRQRALLALGATAAASAEAGSAAASGDDDSNSGGGGGHGNGGGNGDLGVEGAMYFETSAMLITFVALGQWLQAYTKGKTSSAVRSLLELSPDTATLLQPNLTNQEPHQQEQEHGQEDQEQHQEEEGGSGAVDPALTNNGNNSANGVDSGAIDREETSYSEVSIDARLLMRGDLVLVRGGERLPCDGTLVKDLGMRNDSRSEAGAGAGAAGSGGGGGNVGAGAANDAGGGGVACVDESMLTGESLPVHKKVGDTLLGGTVNVGGAPFWMRATGVGAATALQVVNRQLAVENDGAAAILVLTCAFPSFFFPPLLCIPTHNITHHCYHHRPQSPFNLVANTTPTHLTPVLSSFHPPLFIRLLRASCVWSRPLRAPKPRSSTTQMWSQATSCPRWLPSLCCQASGGGSEWQLGQCLKAGTNPKGGPRCFARCSVSACSSLRALVLWAWRCRPPSWWALEWGPHTGC
jgi:cation transport ATPase